MYEEYGDLLFVAALIGRHIEFNSEECLRQANFKFIGRFNAAEDYLRLNENMTLSEADIEDMTAAWIAIKKNHSDKE